MVRSFNLKTINLGCSHVYVGHADRGFASSGIEKDVPVGPGVVYRGSSILLGEEFLENGDSNGAYMYMNTDRGVYEMGYSRANHRQGVALIRSLNEEGSYTSLGYYDENGQPHGLFITFGATMARVESYRHGMLLCRSVLIGAEGVLLGHTAHGETEILKDRLPASIIDFSSLEPSLGEMSYGLDFHIDADRAASGRLGEDIECGRRGTGFGVDVSTLANTRLGNFNRGQLSGIGISLGSHGNIFGSFEDGRAEGACIKIDGAACLLASYSHGTASGVRIECNFKKGHLKITDGKGNFYTVKTDKEASITEVIGKDGSAKFTEYHDSYELDRVSTATKQINALHSEDLSDGTKRLLRDYEYQVEMFTDDRDIEHREIWLTRSHTTDSEVTLPTCARSLSQDCFRGNEALETLTVTKSIYSVGDNCFRDCRNLKKLILKAPIEIICAGSFAGTALREVVFPESTLIIRSGAFEGCDMLREVWVPEGCRVMSGAFPEGCRIHRGKATVFNRLKTRLADISEDFEDRRIRLANSIRDKRIERKRARGAKKTPRPERSAGKSCKFLLTIGAFFVVLGGGIAKVFRAIGRGLKRVFGGVGRGIAAAFLAVGRAIAFVFSAIWRGIVFIFSGIGRGFAAIGRGIAGIFGRRGSYRSYSSSRSYGSSTRVPNGWEIAAAIIGIILVILSATRSTEAIIEWLNGLVSDVFPNLYEISLPRLVLNWMEAEADIFFLLLPLLWLLQLVCLLLSFVGQLILWILLGVGHLLSLILSVVFQIVVFYLLLPATCVFLIVKRARGDEISIFSIIFAIICTVAFYLLRAMPAFA